MLKRKQLVFQIFPVYFFIGALVLILSLYFAFSADMNLSLNQETKYMNTLLSHFVSDIEKQDMQEDLQKLTQHVDGFSESFGLVISLIDAKGQVVYDSHAEATKLLSLRRPEVSAFSNNKGHLIFDKKLFVGTPIMSNGNPLFLAFGSPLGPLYLEHEQVRNKVILAGLLVLGVVMFVMCLLTASALRRSFEVLCNSVARFSSGDFSGHVPKVDPLELSVLSDGLNEMSASIQTQIQGISQASSVRDLILSSMVEGVFSLDKSGKITLINQAATEMFGVEQEAVSGQYFQYVLRHAQLVEFVESVLAKQVNQSGLIYLRDSSASIIKAEASIIHDQKGVMTGLVVVLHDITDLKRLEQLKQEFVGNVSHELRTPITLIQGFVETLEEGALEKPETAKRFIRIIKTHAQRLDNIIEDLLSLSRIEQEEAHSLETETMPLKRILEEAMELVKTKADLRNVKLKDNCDPDTQVTVNGRLILQAVVNLLDNAVKYTQDEGVVKVRCFSKEGLAFVEVEDNGPGIASEHLSKLFSRFYRVDKARSRQLGGSGLGLAIVKHIIKVHGGDVIAESKLGSGSTFRIQLPLATNTDRYGSKKGEQHVSHYAA